ncbi:MAG: GNAT family N-acetyltransferase [Clostridiales bacterium]|nr:GNAT family N-acetyltransferase [Clostridiales bacterium]
MERLRKAAETDLPAIAALEAACFPPTEAAGEEALRARLAAYPQHFWLLERDGAVVSMVNGMVTDQRDLTDEMYERAELHEEGGRWQMIFGVDTHPDCRRQGLAARTLTRFLEDAREQGRQGVVLTCKERLIPYYAKFGFQNEGVSPSIHGGVVWYQMRLTFFDESSRKKE